VKLIPTTKVVLSGRRDAGQSYIKFATAQLAILERQMSFQNLNEGRRIVSPSEGVIVECISRFGRKEVRIDVTPAYVDIKPTTEEIAPSIEIDRLSRRAKKIPLVAGGYFYVAMDDQKAKRSLCYYNKVAAQDGKADTSAFSCTPIVDDPTYSQHTFFQVKYAPVHVVDSKDKIFTLAICKGYTLNEPPIPPTIINIIKITTTDTNYIEQYEAEEIKDQDGMIVSDRSPFILHSFEERIDQMGLSNKTSFSANFNSDMTKLFVVYSENPVILPDPPVSSTSVIIYKRNDDLTWSMETNNTYTFDYHMEYAYVDRAGIVWGLHRTIAGSPPTYEYATFNIETGVMAAASTHSIGYSVTEGNFEGIFLSKNDTLPSSTPLSGQGNQTYTGNCATLTYIDDGGNIIYGGDTPCGGGYTACVTALTRCYACGCPAGECMRVRYDTTTGTYWYSWSSYASSTGCMKSVASVGSTKVSTSTGVEDIKTCSGVSTSFVERMVACSYCGRNGEMCLGSTETAEISNLWTYKGTNEWSGAIGGTLSRGKVGYEKKYDYVASLIRNFDPAVYCWLSGQLVYAVCNSFNPEVRTDFDQLDIFHPFYIGNSQAVSSFIAWDNNLDGLII